MAKVTADIREDDTRPFGYALISFPVQLGSSGPVALSITRKSADTPYLGQQGWQARPTALTVETIAREETSTTLLLGPEICDRIPVDLQVRIQVEGSDIWSAAFWPSITPSVGGGQSGLDGVDTLQVPKKPAASKPPPSPKPLPPLPPAPEAPPVQKSVSPEPATGSRRQRKLWSALLVLLFLAAGAGWYFGRDFLPRHDAAIETETLAQKLERLRQTDQDGDELFKLGQEAQAAGDASVLFQATELSMLRGFGAAKLQMGRWYDPRYANTDIFDRPAANNAARYYFELSVEGDNEAKALLSSLCEESRNPESAYTDSFEGFLGSTYCEGSMGQ